MNVCWCMAYGRSSTGRPVGVIQCRMLTNHSQLAVESGGGVQATGLFLSGY
jgi:hypothetical protein